METTYHTPVLLEKSIEMLNINPKGVYVDVTMGGAGHTKEILKHLTTGRLFAFDQDIDAINNAPKDKKLTFIRSNFRYLKNWMRYYNVEKIDGLLADLGVSSHHLDTAERGFSFRFDAELDMRMNRKAEFSAKHIVNNYTEEQLTTIFKLYGELPNAKKTARAIVNAAGKKTIETTQELYDAVKITFKRDREKKEMAKLFQALRIETNNEMQALSEMLHATEQVMKPQGRLVVITYHSIEDRIVKNFIKCGNIEGKENKDFFGNIERSFKATNNKPFIPEEKELEENTRSRSAKLRAAERL